MKILAYSHREDETEYFKEFSKKYKVEVVLCEEAPTMENVDLAKGFDCISIITTMIPDKLVEKFHQVGVKFISTRTIGYDHIDIKKAKELGVHVGNVTYSPNSVANYTVMMILMAIRKMKTIMECSNVQDYSLKGVQGKELQNLTVGVIGTGRIGQTVIKHLSGFECELLAYDLYENKKIKEYAKYVALEKLFKNSDIITMHVPATEDNYHLIDKGSISAMKEGVFIINTARGSLINTGDLIQGIEQKKIGGAALDVIENESNIYYNDLKCEILDNRELAILKSYPNVIVTPHTAFYTDQAVSDMVEHSILSCILFMEGKENPWQVA
ncbi:D-isomer specific 2-hydroxyacid dehydrogenase family protein [Clostridium sp.]|jgi:D-lactate dehydrogenase|uniref:D-isomer specific 2-hydroxyacid dehydrogenase family protein n=1 Tax=Clostridium sp. TaxID=1506 RepID=UPI00258E55AA|nr:D-isomer specific 2-hydroxyacid dehydrogenase family protein [Clostridium sp.]MDF2503858.1 lactate dehydrogenase-like oxidoreductase [Clostridium sp.]